MGSLTEANLSYPIATVHIEEIRSQLKGDSQLVAPVDEGFPDLLKRWSTAASKPAGAVLLATNNADISTAVSYARDHSFALTVAGGRHATSGSSSSDGGIVIDLRQMRAVSVDTSAKTITAQGGCLWSDVDDALAEHGLATVGGTVHHTGIGGLTLGGGFGFLTAAHGLTIDNLLSVKMVLASGEVVEASADENQELFWAVRGAGQMFGVVTEFVFQAWEQTDVWGGFLIFPTEKIDSVLESCNNVFHDLKTSGMGMFGFLRPPPMGGATAVMVAVMNNDPSPEKGRALFKPLFDLEPLIDQTRSMPYREINHLMPTQVEVTASMKGAAFTMPVRREFVHSMLAQYHQYVDNTEGAGESAVIWEMVPTSIIQKTPIDATACANRGSHMNSMIVGAWKDPEHQPKCRQWARDTFEMFEEELKRSKKTENPNEGTMIYGNYDDGQHTSSASKIFGPNFPRLLSLKQKYDPSNLFKGPFVIGA